MSTLSEIEAAIQNLPAPQVDELAHWLDELRRRRLPSPHVEAWLERARGAALVGLTAKDVMGLTRGDE
jgi:hypothetical protein